MAAPEPRDGHAAAGIAYWWCSGCGLADYGAGASSGKQNQLFHTPTLKKSFVRCVLFDIGRFAFFSRIGMVFMQRGAILLHVHFRIAGWPFVAATCRWHRWYLRSHGPLPTSEFDVLGSRSKFDSHLRVCRDLVY
jgi:hypothetical protein